VGVLCPCRWHLSVNILSGDAALMLSSCLSVCWSTEETRMYAGWKEKTQCEKTKVT
jgi:hypothetical protein